MMELRDLIFSKIHTDLLIAVLCGAAGLVALAFSKRLRLILSESLRRPSQKVTIEHTDTDGYTVRDEEGKPLRTVAK